MVGMASTEDSIVASMSVKDSILESGSEAAEELVDLAGSDRYQVLVMESHSNVDKLKVEFEQC